MGYQGRYQKSKPKASAKTQPVTEGVQKKPSGKKKTWLIVLIIVLVLILGVAGGVAAYAGSLLNLVSRAEYSQHELSDEELELEAQLLGNFDPEDETEPEMEPEPETTVPPATTEPEVSYGKTGKIVNILLIGDDSRPGEDSKLSDSIILVTVNKENKTLNLTSFVRDSFVKLPDYVDSKGKKHDCGKNRINTAYALGYLWDGDLGGMKMMDQCIFENYGVEIDHNVSVNFEAFAMAINALGGLDIELNEDEAKYMNKNSPFQFTYEEGMNHFKNGWEVLCYARMRKSNLQDNDFKRGNRQRYVISLIVDKCKSLSLKELNDLMKTMLPMITTDMSKEEISTYAFELLPLVVDLTVVSNQCPAEGTYGGRIVEISGIESGVVVPDLNKNREIILAYAGKDQ